MCEYVANPSLFAIAGVDSVFHPGDCNTPAAARRVAWHWEILNCIFQDRLFVLYTHKDGEKIQSHFFNMLLLTALINLVSAASE